MIAFERQGVALCGYDVGAGQPVLFQHGLGGDDAQVAESFPSDPSLRRLTLECRGHGGSALGRPDGLSIAQFAEDVLAFVNRRGVERFAAGGISMGAAIALRLATLHPERVTALALVRPAWVAAPAPANLQPFRDVAPFLCHPDAAEGWAAFQNTSSARRLEQNGLDNLASLEGFFHTPRRADLAQLVERIARDAPGVSRAQLAAVQMPVLVIGNEEDAVHPVAYAKELARLIPSAQLVIVPPKARDKAVYLSALSLTLSDFFTRHTGERVQSYL